MFHATTICSRFFLRAQRAWCRKLQTSSESAVQQFTLRRAMMYVPGNDKKKMEKSLMLDVDCIAFDCEDGVAQNKKVQARETIKGYLDQGPPLNNSTEWCVRINSVGSGLCESDLNVILSAKYLPATLALTKVEDVDQLQWFAEKVWQKLNERPENDRGPINLIMFAESARAMMTLPEICQKAQDLSTMAPIVPVGLVLGGDDLLADLGATKTEGGRELFYVQQKLVLVAKAFRLQAIDIVTTNLKSSEALKESATSAYFMGFTGKQIIHPSQIEIVQEAFIPPHDTIKWAEEVVSRFKKFQSEGRGAFIFKGKMIDMPSIRQAENVLKLAKRAGKIKNIVSSGNDD